MKPEIAITNSNIFLAIALISNDKFIQTVALVFQIVYGTLAMVGFYESKKKK